MKNKWVISLVLLLFLNGCKQNTNFECTKDSDCAMGGCSGQICAPTTEAKDTITTCEFREEYNCLKLSSCGCVNNQCQWDENSEYKNCLEGVRD